MGLSDFQIERMAEAFSNGMSRSKGSKYAGVAESTYVSWRSFAIAGELEMPSLCGCGRTIKHQGQCTFRRLRAASPEEKK